MNSGNISSFYPLSDGLVTMSYLVSAIFFILSLGGLSKQETARRGNLYGIVGMTIAVLATFLSGKVSNFELLVPLMLGGAIIGAVMARRVEMTSMPELVAILHSFVGLAAVLVGIASLMAPVEYATSAAENIHLIEIY